MLDIPDILRKEEAAYHVCALCYKEYPAAENGVRILYCNDIITDQTSLMKAGIELAKRTWDLAAKTLADWRPELIDQYICHQVGARHSRLLFETLGIENKKSFQTFPFLGNMGPASAPITLAMAAEKGVIKALSRVAVLGIGSGLNCSMMEIVW